MPRKQSRAIAVIDCETDPFKFGRPIAPFVWGFFDGERYYYFWGENAAECNDALLHFLEGEAATADEPLIIYAHNGGKFDFLFLMEHFDPELLLVNGRVAKATLFDGKIELRDSFMILPISLSDYDKYEIDYNKMEAGVRNLHKDEILRYLRKDCESLYVLCRAFIDRFGLQLTLASTAFRELKKTGYECKSTFDEYDKFFRQFYFGGRVQCFEIGHFEGEYEYVDINSAYPFAMIHPHWHGSDYITHKRMPDGDNGSWFAEIEAVSRGALPVRADKLYFPHDTGPRRYFATGWEIIAGVQTGTLDVKKVHVVHRPRKLADMRAYIDFWFAEKARWKGVDDVQYLFAKFMQNAAYGKFAQDGREFTEDLILPFGEWPDSVEGKPDWKYGEDLENGFTLFHRPAPQHRFYNVATAASITGFVRACLWRNIVSSVRPLYCDTDSLICAKFGGKKGRALGEWNLEAALSEANIAARKMYACREHPVSELGPINRTKVASKGVRLSFEQIREGVIRGENIVFEKDSPAYSIKKGMRYFSREIDFKNIQKNLATISD